MNPIVDFEKVKELYEQGLSDYKIAEQVSCANSTVHRWRIKHNLPTHNPMQPPKRPPEHYTPLDAEIDAEIKRSENGNILDSAYKRINVILGTMDRSDIQEVIRIYHDLSKEILNEALSEYFKTFTQRKTTVKATNNDGGSGNT